MLQQLAGLLQGSDAPVSLTADSDAARIDVAWQLAVVNKSFDEPVLDLLKSLYDGADEGVRHAVVNAIGYRGWDEGLAFLRVVAKTRAVRSPRMRKKSSRRGG